MPTNKKALRKGKGPKQEGSPIKVGGGGGKRKKGLTDTSVVWCEFNHNAYPTSDTGRRKKFENPNWHVQSLKFTLRGVTSNLSGFLPADGSCTIDIERQGNDNDLLISGESLGITFDTETYQFVTGSDVKHQNGNSRPTKVKIKTGNLTIDEEFEPLDIWKIEVNYVRS